MEYFFSFNGKAIQMCSLFGWILIRNSIIFIYTIDLPIQTFIIGNFGLSKKFSKRA